MTPGVGATQPESDPPFREYWQQLTRRLEDAWPAGLAQFFQALPHTQIKTIAAAVGDGQHVRAHLLCLVNSALGGRSEDALPRALAIECIHAASLIHDDYVDQDRIRRQRRATWVVAGPRQAVLLGDIIFATAIQRMVELSRADGLVVAETIATMAHGAYRELLDPNELSTLQDSEHISPEIYERIIYLKTGTLFAAAAKLGAIAAAAPVEIGAHAFRFGALFGAAYQIADDLDDIIALENDWHAARAKLPFLLPAFLFFYRAEFCVAWMQDENNAALQSWFNRESTTLKARMVQEIARRTDLAINQLEPFPGNVHTAWLRYAPKEILRKSCA